MQFLQQPVGVKLDEACTALAVFQFTDAQQAAKTRHQGVGFANRLLQRFGLRRVIAGLLANAVELGAQAGQRGAQVVGDVVAHAFDLHHQPLDALEHGVDDGRQHVQFVTAVGQWQAAGQVAGDDGFGTGLDGTDAPQRAPAQQVPAGETRDDGQRYAPEQGVEDDAGHREQRAIVTHQHQPAAVLGALGYGVAAVAGQLGVVGVDALGQFVDMPVEVQLWRYMLHPACQVTELGIEQAVGIEGTRVEALAGGQGVVQLLALHVGKQVLAL
ncbi:hypothetical protein D9M71_428900 [compost metagenome]